MERIEYLRLILKGLAEHPDSLEGYFFRECKKAESLFIENEEFFSGLTKAIESLYQDIDDRYYKQLNNFEMVKSNRIREGRPIEDLENHIPRREQQYAFLPKVTNDIILGNLHFSLINKLEQAIIKTQMKFLSIQIEAIEKERVILKRAESNNLTPFEIAIKDQYLSKANKIDKIHFAKDFIERYKGLRSSKNLEEQFNHLNNNRRKPNRKQLQNVHDSLSEYPDIQKAIINDIDQLN